MSVKASHINLINITLINMAACLANQSLLLPLPVKQVVVLLPEYVNVSGRWDWLCGSDDGIHVKVVHVVDI